MTLAWGSELLTGAERAAGAAASLRQHLDEALRALRAARREVDPELEDELVKTISVVRQAYDLTDEFRSLYTKLPKRVAELKKTAVSLKFAEKRLRGFRDDLGRVDKWAGAIGIHLDTAKRFFTRVLDPDPHGAQAVAWRDLRTQAAEQVAHAGKDLTELSGSSAQVLHALGFEADLMEGQGRL